MKNFANGKESKKSKKIFLKKELLEVPLNQTIVLSSIGVKNSAGYYPAVSPGLTNFLIVGDRVRFTNAGHVYHAKIVSATKKQVQNQYEYELQLITVPQEILSSISSVSCKRLTVPRKNAAYVYIGDDNTVLQSDGLFPITNNELPPFTAWNKGDATPLNWQKNAEITLYDVHSHALEASDVNSQYAATKMSSDQTQVLTTAANARYDEFAFSGAEDKLVNGSFGGGVSKGAGSVTPSKFHTGSSSLLLTPTQSGYIVALKTDSKRKYFNASGWVHETNAAGAQLYYAFQPDGQSIPANTAINIDLSTAKKAGQWYQFNVLVPVPVALPTPVIKYTLHLGIKNNGAQPIYVDDFRVHPMDAAMTSYVYNQWGELSHILDNNNLYTEYKYDGMGRLKETYKESFQNSYRSGGAVKVSEVNYNYGANNPYKVTLTASSSGSTGKITPPGPSDIPPGGELRFEISKTTCTVPYINSVTVDGKQLSMAQGITTLHDGTEVHVSGYTLTFKKVVTPHSIHVNFYSFDGQGYARCYQDQNGCQDGSFEYWYYTSCGAQGTKYRVFGIDNVPMDLRQHLPEGGCPPTSGQNCGIEQQ